MTRSQFSYQHDGVATPAARSGRNSTSNTKNNYKQYRDSSLAMCLDVTKEAAIGIYDYAEPKVIKGVHRFQRIQLKPPQCGPVTSSSSSSRKGGTERRSPKQQPVHQKNRQQRRPGRSRSSSSTSSDIFETPNHVTAPRIGSSSHSDDTSIDSKRRGRGRRRRGRSPTMRSNSVNAQRNRELFLMNMRRAKSAAPRLLSWDKDEEEQGEQQPQQQQKQPRPGTSTPNRQGTVRMNPDHYCHEPAIHGAVGAFTTPNASTEGPQQGLIKRPTFTRRHSSALEYDSHHPDNNSNSNKSSPSHQTHPQELQRGTFRQLTVQQQQQQQQQSVCDLFSVKSPNEQHHSSHESQGMDSSAPPTILMSNGKDVRNARRASLLKEEESELKEEHENRTSTPQPARMILSSPNKPNSAKELSPVSLMAPPTGRSSTKEMAPSLVHHMHQGNDVTIVVGTGQRQQTFCYNSHVLLYISDYFSQVMQPDQSGSSCSAGGSSAASGSSATTPQTWRIDFTHKRVEEWDLFYPFLEPPVKRTVAIDIFNLPVLLPWFHEFQLPLLLHQCDVMLSSLMFRTWKKAQTSDLQDVLLMLYTALSCDLPQTQDLGIQVVVSYLKDAPQLFLQHSAIQRLIILLQCFPLFQQQLWFSSIRTYLPLDLDSCCDMDTTSGRDELLQNPLFSFLLREGLTKAKAKARTRHYLRQKQQLKSCAATTATATTTTSASLPPKEEVKDDSENDTDPTPSVSPTETFLEELSGMTPLEPGTAPPPKSLEHTDSSEQPLEMTQFLGDQFWGNGWNEEPRLSEESDRRQQDRRQWLEDVVQMLKEHAHQEQHKEREVKQRSLHQHRQPQDPQRHRVPQVPQHDNHRRIVTPSMSRSLPPPTATRSDILSPSPLAASSDGSSQGNRQSQHPTSTPTTRPAVFAAATATSLVATKKADDGRAVVESPDLTMSTTEPSSVEDIHSTDSSRRTFTC